VQDIIGHESAEISAHYTHIESDAKAAALDTMPTISYQPDNSHTDDFAAENTSKDH